MTKAKSNPQRPAPQQPATDDTTQTVPAAQVTAEDPQDDLVDDVDAQDDTEPPAEPAPPAAPPAKPAKAVAVVGGGPSPADRLTALAATVVAEQNGRHTEAVPLSILLEACEKYGLDPSAKKKPREILGWKFYPATDEDGIQVPDAVVLVTAGGRKLKHYEDPAFPMDPDTVAQLRHLFNAWTIDANKQVQPAPLPDDLTLPASAVDGKVRETAHVYQGGYLKTGGKVEADRRDARKQDRLKKLGLA